MDLRTQLTNCTSRDVSLFTLSGTRTIGKIVEMYDGDTCKIVIPLYGGLQKFNCRLNGVDTPEMKPKTTSNNRENEINAAHRARNFLLNLSTNCDSGEVELSRHLTKTECMTLLNKNTKLIYVVCGEFDKYGRLLVELYDDENITQPSYNQRLITEGYAKSYSGGTKEAFDAPSPNDL